MKQPDQTSAPAPSGLGHHGRRNARPGRGASRARAELRRLVRWANGRVPAGLRSLLGVLAIIGGCFGFLPVLGFWMIPAGAVLIALDIPPLRRRLMGWLERSDRQQQD